MDVWSNYRERINKQKRFKQLSIKEQLDELQKETHDYNKVIGAIYVQNPPEFKDRNQLSSLLDNAELIEEMISGGQGDSGVELLFSKNNLLIGATYFAYYGNPLSLIQECNVYRFSENESLDNLDLNKIKKEIFTLSNYFPVGS